MTDPSLKKHGISFSVHFSGNDLICKASDFYTLTRFSHFPQQAIFHSCFDCAVRLFGGICGSGSRENAVAQQVTKNYYALILFRTSLPFS